MVKVVKIAEVCFAGYRHDRDKEGYLHVLLKMGVRGTWTGCEY